MRTLVSLLTLSLLAAGASCALADDASDASTKILLIGKDRDHAPRTHEYMAESELLARCLKQTSGVETVVSNGWPTDPKVLEGVDAIVLYTAVGGNVLFADPERRAQVESLLKQGVGLVEIHWGTDAEPGEAAEKQLEHMGAWFHRTFSEIPIVDSVVTQADPDHPIARGWDDFPMRDEYYIKLKFRPEAKPLMKAEVNGETYVVGWALDRPDGGRSFGTVCGHFHECFANDSFRQAVVNGILWAAGVEIPEGGAPCAVSREDLELPPDPRVTETQ